MQGRYDLVIEKEGEVAIVDFKTGDVRDAKAAEKRAKESLQLDIYALAQLKTKGRLPDRVELRFLESGLVAGRRPTAEEAAVTEERIRAAAAAIRRREFPAKPTWMACGQCPFREICPHTAWDSPPAPTATPSPATAGRWASTWTARRTTRGFMPSSTSNPRRPSATRT